MINALVPVHREVMILRRLETGELFVYTWSPDPDSRVTCAQAVWADVGLTPVEKVNVICEIRNQRD